MFLNSLGNNFCFSGSKFCFRNNVSNFQGWANRETFEETSRITNVSTTMFPSLPRALTYIVLIPHKRKVNKLNTGLRHTLKLYTDFVI